MISLNNQFMGKLLFMRSFIAICDIGYFENAGNTNVAAQSTLKSQQLTFYKDGKSLRPLNLTYPTKSCKLAKVTQTLLHHSYQYRVAVAATR